jgi:hypothetical protein
VSLAASLALALSVSQAHPEPPVSYWVLRETPSELSLLKADSITRSGDAVRYQVVGFVSVPFHMRRGGGDGWVQSILDEVEVDCPRRRMTVLGSSFRDAGERLILRDDAISFDLPAGGAGSWQALSFDYVCKRGVTLSGTYLPLDIIKELYLNAAHQYVSGKTAALPAIGR